MLLYGYGPALLQGAWVTIQVSLLSLALAVAGGLIGAALKLAKNRLLNLAAQTYTTVIRGVPDLVMMLLVFYGGQVLLNEVSDHFDWPPLDLDPYAAGVLTIGFIFGAYFTETFRGAFMAVPAGQIEAGHAYGMSRWRVFHRILLPQMLRHALPGIGNNWLVLLKSTAIISMIGLTELTLTADQAGRSTHQPFQFYIVVCFMYLALTSLSSFVLHRLARRADVGVRAHEI